MARFTHRDAAENAATELQHAGYRATMMQEVWAPANGQARRLAAPVVVGGILGLVAATPLAAVWWAFSATFGAWNVAALPISRALVAAIIFLTFLAIGTWAGDRWQRGRDVADATAQVGDEAPGYAVVTLVPGTQADVAPVRRLLEAHEAERIELRRAA